MMLQTGFAITMAEAFLPFTGTVFFTVLQHIQPPVRTDSFTRSPYDPSASFCHTTVLMASHSHSSS